MKINKKLIFVLMILLVIPLVSSAETCDYSIDKSCPQSLDSWYFQGECIQNRSPYECKQNIVVADCKSCGCPINKPVCSDKGQCYKKECGNLIVNSGETEEYTDCLYNNIQISGTLHCSKDCNIGSKNDIIVYTNGRINSQPSHKGISSYNVELHASKKIQIDGKIIISGKDGIQGLDGAEGTEGGRGIDGTDAGNVVLDSSDTTLNGEIISAGGIGGKGGSGGQGVGTRGTGANGGTGGQGGSGGTVIIKSSSSISLLSTGKLSTKGGASGSGGTNGTGGCCDWEKKYDDTMNGDAGCSNGKQENGTWIELPWGCYFDMGQSCDCCGYVLGIELFGCENRCCSHNEGHSGANGASGRESVGGNGEMIAISSDIIQKNATFTIESAGGKGAQSGQQGIYEASFKTYKTPSFEVSSSNYEKFVGGENFNTLSNSSSLIVLKDYSVSNLNLNVDKLIINEGAKLKSSGRASQKINANSLEIAGKSVDFNGLEIRNIFSVAPVVSAIELAGGNLKINDIDIPACVIGPVRNAFSEDIKTTAMIKVGQVKTSQTTILSTAQEQKQEALELCSIIPDEDTKNLCYITAAAELLDKSVCDNITNDAQKNTCKGKVDELS